MNDSLYILRCSNRSYFARYTIILITSRDCSHITWFRNSASVSLLATLSHKTWVANDFSSSQLFQKRSKRLRLHFLKIFLQTKNFFFIHLLYAKSTLNNDRIQLSMHLNMHFHMISLRKFSLCMSFNIQIDLKIFCIHQTNQLQSCMLRLVRWKIMIWRFTLIDIFNQNHKNERSCDLSWIN